LPRLRSLVVTGDWVGAGMTGTTVETLMISPPG
jgi:hypothetical protein